MKKEAAQDSFERGFSLIELLVVVLVMSIVVIALYDLYDANNKINAIQQQVISMNFRTRTALEDMVTAIRTAGSNNQFAKKLGGNPFIARAEAHDIRVVEDLPRDSFGAGCTAGPDGDTFDRCDTTIANGKFLDDNEDENADGWINDPNEDVTYSLSGTDLIKTQYEDDSYCPVDADGCTGCTCPGPTSEVLATDITALTFEYYMNTNSNPAQLAPPPVSFNDRLNVRIVRITLDAKTHSKDLQTGQQRTLRLQSDVFIRNN